MYTNIGNVFRSSATALVAVTLIATLLLSLGSVAGLMDPNTGTVKGTVTDTNDGKPIEGAEVTISYHGITRTDITDALGTYKFTLVPECYCLKTVKATKDAYRPESKDVGVSGVTVVDFQLFIMELEPHVGIVMGTVTDYHDGEPIIGARVELEYDDRIRTIYTDTEGMYWFGQVPEGLDLKEISVSMDRYLPQSAQVEVDGETVVDFALWIEELPPTPEEGTIKGMVTDYNNGLPIGGAHVTLEYEDVIRTVLTDADGRYSFEGVPIGDLLKEVSVTMATFIPQSQKVVAETETIVDFALWVEEGNPPPQGGVLSGIVTDADTGSPIEGALVTLRHEGEVLTDHTDADGSYTITGIPMCFCMKGVEVTKNGYDRQERSVAVDETTTEDFTLDKKGSDESVIRPDVTGGEGTSIGSMGVNLSTIGMAGLFVVLVGITVLVLTMWRTMRLDRQS
jgi:protocatechuate 3,4-dioxygenase beta subunit